MRSLAAFYDRAAPEILAVCEIDAGDALALATRFALQWAYRGGQAVFWQSTMRATGIRDNYLPFTPARPFERRGIVEVTMQMFERPGAVLATQIGTERDQRVREVRHLRSVALTAPRQCIVFSIMPPNRVELGGMGFTRAGCRGVEDEAVFVRGLEIIDARDQGASHRGIGTPIAVRLRAIQPA